MAWSADSATSTRRSSLSGKSRWLAAHALLIGAVLVAAAGPARAATPAASGALAQSLSGTLTVGGSTALQPLVDRAARDFQRINSDVQITVMGGGSGTGRGGVCQGNLDIGLSDVPLTDTEKTTLNCTNAMQTAIAIDAFVAVANPSGPGNLNALNREQMQHIFSGSVQNWADVQGSNQPLVVINRLRGSGTRQSMANYLFGGDDSVFSGALTEQDNSQDIANTVSQTSGAISYLGLAYLNNPNLVTLGIQMPDGNVLLPTRDVVKVNQWPIGGPGLAITRGQPSAVAAAFLSYVSGSDFATDPAWDDFGLVPPANPSIGNQFGY
jgi:phosphate transport system substrate-binding protein